MNNLANLTGYHVAQSEELPPFQAIAQEFWMAGNGLFIRCDTPAATAVFPVASADVPGLPRLESRVSLKHRPLPVTFIASMLAHASMYKDIEVVYQVILSDGRLSLRVVQYGSKASSGDFVDAPGHVVLQAHSHNTMPAFWSQTDNAHELESRFFMVFGRLDLPRPHVRLRFGISGRFLEVPLATLFDDDVRLINVVDLYQVLYSEADHED